MHTIMISQILRRAGSQNVLGIWDGNMGTQNGRYRDLLTLFNIHGRQQCNHGGGGVVEKGCITQQL
jgi:hypothetical protein